MKKILCSCYIGSLVVVFYMISKVSLKSENVLLQDIFATIVTMKKYVSSDKIYNWTVHEPLNRNLQTTKTWHDSVTMIT